MDQIELEATDENYRIVTEHDMKLALSRIILTTDARLAMARISAIKTFCELFGEPNEKDSSNVSINVNFPKT